MSRRIEIELTSRRDETTWTWRAAGAKQPKGVLAAELLPSDAKPGDQLRAEANFEIDGIFITEVLSPKKRSGRPEDERIELLSSSDADGKVTATLARKKGRGKKPPRGGRQRGERSRGDRSRGDRPKGDRQRGERSKGDRTEGEGESKRRSRRSGTSRRAQSDESLPLRPKPPRLKAKKHHRKSFIEALPDEQQVVAEQLMRGGIAAVRSEIKDQNEKSAASGEEKIDAKELLDLSEKLLSGLRPAEWRDRIDAAIAAMDKVDLRDLRSVIVAGEDFARDAETRALVEQVRAGLAERLIQSQELWHDDLRKVLAEGRVVRALRLSSYPPRPGSPLPPDLAKDLTEKANAALGHGTAQDRLAAVLDAVAHSPVRPYVVLASVPTEPNTELLSAVKRVASRIPEIAKQFGIEPKKGASKKEAAAPTAPAESAPTEKES